MKQEFKIISNFIEKNTRVLDVGCGDGTLIEFLRNNKEIDIRGIEISKDDSQKCVGKGLTVIEGDAEKDLYQFTFMYTYLWLRRKEGSISRGKSRVKITNK